MLDLIARTAWWGVLPSGMGGGAPPLGLAGSLAWCSSRGGGWRGPRDMAGESWLHACDFYLHMLGYMARVLGWDVLAAGMCGGAPPFGPVELLIWGPSFGGGWWGPCSLTRGDVATCLRILFPCAWLRGGSGGVGCLACGAGWRGPSLLGWWGCWNDVPPSGGGWRGPCFLAGGIWLHAGGFYFYTIYFIARVVGWGVLPAGMGSGAPSLRLMGLLTWGPSSEVSMAGIVYYADFMAPAVGRGVLPLG